MRINVHDGVDYELVKCIALEHWYSRSVAQCLRRCITKSRSWVRSSPMPLFSQTLYPLARYLCLIAYIQRMVALRPSSCSWLTRLGICFLFTVSLLWLIILTRKFVVVCCYEFLHWINLLVYNFSLSQGIATRDYHRMTSCEPEEVELSNRSSELYLFTFERDTLCRRTFECDFSKRTQ